VPNLRVKDKEEQKKIKRGASRREVRKGEAKLKVWKKSRRSTNIRVQNTTTTFCTKGTGGNTYARRDGTGEGKRIGARKNTTRIKIVLRYPGHVAERDRGGRDYYHKNAATIDISCALIATGRIRKGRSNRGRRPIEKSRRGWLVMRFSYIGE